MTRSPRPFRARVRRLAADAAVSIAVTAGLFLLLEIGLRAFAPQTPRTENVSGEPRAEEDSVLGHRYRPGAKAVHRTPEFTVDYEINAFGHRDPTPPRLDDTLAVRVLLLGDSFTFGAGNRYRDTWAAVMESTLVARGLQVDVINAGVEGYDTRSERLLLERLTPQVRPRIVLLAFLTNDVYTNLPSDSLPPASARTHQAGGFVLHAVEWAKRLAMQNDRVYARLFLTTARKDYYVSPPGEHVRRQIEVTRGLLAEMDATCDAGGMRLAVMSIPQQFAVIASSRGYAWPGIDVSGIDRALAETAHDLGVPWVEALPALADAYRTDGADLYYRVDGHLTPRGNRVAGAIAADIVAAASR